MAGIRTMLRSVRPLLPLLVLVLTACGAPGSPGTPLVDLDGRISDTYGVGVPNTSVAPVGRAPVVTGIDGSFTFADVETPYDLVAFVAADEWVHVFLDLTTAEPEVVPGETMLSRSVLEGSQATIELTTDVVVAADQVLVVCVENPDRAMADCEEIVPGDAYPVSLDAGWFGPGSVDATVRGVLYALGTDSLPTEALRMGTATISVEDGDTPALNLTTSTVADVEVGVNVTLPTGNTLDGLGAILILPDGHNAFRVPFGDPVGTGGTIALPGIPGAKVVALAAGSDPSGQVVMAWSDPFTLATTAVDVTLPAVPAMLEPADGAVDVGVGDVIEVEDRPDEAYLFLLEPSGTGPFLLVSSVEGRIAIPDLADLDPALTIPAARPYAWWVLGFGPASGANALASEGGIAGDYNAALFAGGSGFGPGPTAAGWTFRTSLRGFTTP